MSWLARSIAKTLLPSDDEEEDLPSASAAEGETDGDPQSPTKGVKEDISELTKTLTRQFRGFASFLAPPPQSESEIGIRDADEGDDDVDAADSPRALSGFRSDFAEIGGKVRSGISKISEHVAVSEIAKIASSFLPLESDEESDSAANGVVGVTEEVMVFVENIAMHPETWLDFPLLLDEEDYDDFEMTDIQQDHALAVEQLEPRLAALRIELCPAHMTESCFWLIYFVLVHPRLSMQDAQLLSSPQIVEARAKLSNKSQNQPKTETKEIINASEIPILEVPDKSPEIMKTPLETKSSEEPSSKDIHALPSSSSPNKNQENDETLTLTTIPISDDKHPVVVNEVQIVDKSVIKEEGIQIEVQKFESEEIGDGDDEWLQEEDTDNNNNINYNNNVGVSQNVSFGDDEDVSFSDLEEEDEKK
ncbi:hypothetical protein LUZ60_004700 [Juncus effusus]|nr:hypothetical protein LUZ60_004700 [Juncus effusus]